MALAFYASCRSQGRIVLSAIATVLALLGAAASLTPRPQLVSIALSAVVTAAWLSSARDGRARWWLIPLTWVWACSHGMWFVSPLVGGAVVLGLLHRPRSRPPEAVAPARDPRGLLWARRCGHARRTGPAARSALRLRVHPVRQRVGSATPVIPAGSGDLAPPTGRGGDLGAVSTARPLGVRVRLGPGARLGPRLCPDCRHCCRHGRASRRRRAVERAPARTHREPRASCPTAPRRMGDAGRLSRGLCGRWRLSFCPPPPKRQTGCRWALTLPSTGFPRAQWSWTSTGSAATSVTATRTSSQSSTSGPRCSPSTTSRRTSTRAAPSPGGPRFLQRTGATAALVPTESAIADALPRVLGWRSLGTSGDYVLLVEPALVLSLTARRASVRRRAVSVCSGRKSG